MQCINYNELFRFKEVFPTSTEFETWISDITIELPKFSVNEFYDACLKVYYDSGFKHSTFESIKNDMEVLWNRNIYTLNREFELLAEDYDFVKQWKETRDLTETQDETIQRDTSRQDIEDTDESLNRDINSDSYDNPQFDDLLRSQTGKIVTDDDTVRNTDRTINSTIDDDSVRDYDRRDTGTITRSDLTTNEQIEQYMSLYQRFNLYKRVEIFDNLFLNVYVIS